MALRWIEGFESFATSSSTVITNGLISKYSLISGAGTSADGIYTGFSAKGNSLALYTPVLVDGDVASASSTWVTGFHVNFPTFSSTLSLAEAWANNTQQLRLELFSSVATSGGLRVIRNTTTLGTVSSILSNNIWYHIEFKFFVNDSTGTFSVKVNGSSVLSGGPTDTKNDSTVSGVNIFGHRVNNNARIDNIYILDGTGTTNTDFLGPMSVVGIKPNANGSENVWSPSSGSNYTNLSSADDDSSYVFTSGQGLKELYGCSSSSNVKNVKGIQTNVYARKNATGDRKLKTIVKSGSTLSQSPSFGLGRNYRYNSNIFETDPNTGLLWTTSGISSAYFGFGLSGYSPTSAVVLGGEADVVFG